MTDEIAKVRRHLNDIPDLIIEASHYLIPGSAPKDPDAHYAKGPQYRVPIVAEVFDLLDDRDKALDDILLGRRYAGFDKAEPEDFHINNGQRRLGVLPTLGLWVSLAYAEFEDLNRRPRECCPHRRHTISGETAWLSEYAEDIIELHPDFPRDIEQLWTELRRACRIRKEYIPRCPQCGHRIEGVYGDSKDVAPAWWRCTGCSKSWVHDAEVQRLAMTQPRMTLRQIATWLELPLRTLHNWRNQNRIHPDSKGLYEVAHVRNAAKTLGRKVKEEENSVIA